MRLAEELRKSAAVDWTDDPTQTTPTHLLVWDGGRWRLLSNNTELARFDEKVGAAQLLKAISNPAGRPKIFMSLPPSAEIKAALNLGRSSKNNAIELVARPEDANYVLVGTVRDGAVRCAWVLPNAAADANTSPLPVRTFWFPTNGQPDGSATVVARQLEDAALRIGKIKAWLKLESPDDAGRFPYKLAFKNTATGKLMSSEEIKIETSNETGRQQVRTVLPVMKGGEEYSAVLHADPEALKQGVEPRLIYVLTMDSSGHGQLAWPRPGQGNSQSFPPPPGRQPS